ncbi:MAG: LLM class flavin-dependent oxidoreductase [Chloroflexota bacterium]|nr:LLM class flavin-dependent oxidoreductase [Chloroflexota bacterium]
MSGHDPCDHVARSPAGADCGRRRDPGEPDALRAHDRAPAGVAYEEILALAHAAEEAGFEAFFRSDHYASFPGGAGLATTDAGTSLAGLARETKRINLGVLVSPVTFRAPRSSPGRRGR